MPDALDDRLRAVERALDEATDGQSLSDPTDVHADGYETDTCAERNSVQDRLDTVEDRLTEAEETLADLDAAVQALRGYAGQVRSVDERVEERADAALAAVADVEDRLAALEADRTLPGDEARAPRSSSDPEPETARARKTGHDVPDAEWPNSPAPTFDRDADRDRPGLVARLRELL
ncbi:DUF7310 family coiled-coil domain-containing protein [Haloarchaeobius sp. HRN-SO-5]|uniref:DUF7310 family coiled-coil domain-containing protein n=1 Tax=Haloarchaeobius sp. HRN-SO-5 TaxID=3446118 RepID=UPI003EBA763C